VTCITEIRAFGSYITDAVDLGDIDLTLRCMALYSARSSGANGM
jgi:hypothetical protein